jgi:hypothetical protein
MKLKLTQSESRLLCVAAGLLLVLLVLALPIPRLKAATQAAQSEIDKLSPQLTRLQSLVQKEGAYASMTEWMQHVISGELTGYARQIRTEDLIMYAVALERETGLRVHHASFTDPMEISRISGTEQGVQYTIYGVSMTMNCKMSYPAFKEALAFISSSRDQIILNSAAVARSTAGGELSGSISITQIFWGDGSDEPPPLAPFETGNPTLFGAPAGS